MTHHAFPPGFEPFLRCVLDDGCKTGEKQVSTVYETINFFEGLYIAFYEGQMSRENIRKV